jgi:hypothetical protein
VVVLTTGQEGKDKGIPGSVEGRGDDRCILGFIGKFIGSELWPAVGAIAI